MSATMSRLLNRAIEQIRQLEAENKDLKDALAPFATAGLVYADVFFTDMEGRSGHEIRNELDEIAWAMLRNGEPLACITVRDLVYAARVMDDTAKSQGEANV
jgi:hypothetical protein